MDKLIESLPWIVIILVLMWFCYSLWKAGRHREPDKEIYDKELRKRKPFECPYDLKSCDYVDTSTMTIAIQCQDCKRYNKGVRPSKLWKQKKKKNANI